MTLVLPLPVRVPRASPTFPARSGQFLYLSAQKQGSGTLIAEIKVDGATLRQARTTERFGMPSVNGTAH
ncbi:MAG: hypothetical protein ACLQVN_21105 [Bryobacteraceae bacterium]